MLSVSPIILRQTSKFRHLIHKLDISRILVESDAPFLGESHLETLKLVKIIAEEKGMDVEECQEVLCNNFCRFFRINIE